MKKKKKKSMFDESGGLKKRIHAGTFKIADAKENEDGTTTYSFEYDEDFILYYKMQTGRKRVTEKGVNKFILKLLKDREDGSLDKGHSIRKQMSTPKRKFYKVYK